MNHTVFFKRHMVFLCRVVLFFLSVCIYCNSLNGEFVYDDIRTVVENTYLDSFDSIPEIFSTVSYWGNNRASRAYRPVTTFAYLCINVTFGKNPFWYHLFSVLVNAINVVLLFSLLRNFISIKISFAAALVFCLHPVHTEAVANITGMAELLSTMFFLVSFAFLMHCRGKLTWHILPASFALFLGLLSKENVAVVPLIYITYLLLFVDTDKNFLKKLFHYKYCLLASFLTVGTFVFIRSLIVGGMLGLTDINYYDNFIPHVSFLNGKLSAIKVAGIYLSRFIFPYSLLADYSFPVVRPVTGIYDPSLVLYVVPVSALLVLIFAVKNTTVRFGGWFFLISISIVSNLFFSIGTIMGERLMYLPSAGLSILLAVALSLIAEKLFRNNASRNRFFWLLIFILGGAFGIRTIARNADWSTSLSLWNSTIKTTGKSFRAYNNRANIFIDMKEFTRARSDLLKSLEINNGHYATYYTIGRTFDGQNALDSAIYYYTRAIELKPTDYKARVNRGIDLLIQNKFSRAIEDFEMCTRIDPGKFHPWQNLAISYFELEKYDKSLSANTKALLILPDNMQAQILRGRIFLEKEKYMEAETIFSTLPESAETLFYKGYAYLKNGKKDKAAMSLKESIRKYPAVKKTIMNAKEFKEVWDLLE